MLPVLHPVQLFYPTFGTLMGVSPFVAYVNPFDSQYPLMSSQPLGRQMTPWGTVPSCPANTYPIVRTLPTTPPPGTAGLVEKKELGQFPVNRPAGDLRKQQQQQAVGPANASNVEKAAISASRRASHHVFGTEGGNNSSTAPDCQPRAVQSNQQQYSGGFKNHPRVFGPDPRSFPVWKEHY